MNFNLDIQAFEDDKYEFVISIASGQISYEDILALTQNNLIKLD